MTHIIQSPKPRKQGATFADVGVGCLFSFDGETHLKESESAARILCPSSRVVHLEPHFRVRLLSAQPIEPEPDPGMCTYGELERGEWFVWLGKRDVSSGPCRKVSSSRYFEESSRQSFEYEDDAPVQEVRRVSASVVEHEEPGATIVRADTPRVAYIIDGDNSKLWAPEALSALVRKAAHVLAQQAASPESGEPEPGEGRCKADSRCTRPAGHGGCCWSDTWHEKQDRSKPAPGWSVPFLIHGYGDSFGGGGDWCILAPDGEAAVAFGSKGDAIACSYAQQAGKGGESDG